ncbi:MAG TPA: heparinase II/III family protein [Planctomycetota bacterium]|nr:heparinase II/III family protein [Planctomycetota bacterium]
MPELTLEPDRDYGCVMLLVILAVLPVQLAPVSQEDVLQGLRSEHPRLFLDGERVAELEAALESDPLLRKAVADVTARADSYLDAPPLRHELKGPRLLHVSRACLTRVHSLGLAWRLTGERRYADAVRSNLLTVCAFPDWNPAHFLDTAEMSHAVGVGYDWCFAALGEEARETIRRGLIEHGLEPGLRAYTAERPAWWTRSAFNWNQVCNGGLTVGALAIAETDPEYARVVLSHAVRSLPRALETYDPHGAWPEGPGYWGYATCYTAFGLAAMRSALGHDFGLSEREGLARAGFFPLAACGPTGAYVAYADVGERAQRRELPVLFWLADRYAEPALAQAERAWIAAHPASPLHVVWYVPSSEEEVVEPPLDELFEGSVQLALLRGARNDPDAIFVALKAGYNAVNHGHLDLGNFELELQGVRWARDLGSDDYNLPGYWDGKQGGRRWSYYRLGSHSHNVVTLGGEQQAVAGEAEFVAFESTPEAAHAIVEIKGAWPGTAERMRRGAALVAERRALLLRDEFELVEAGEVAWGMTTDAQIEVDGARAVLRQDGKVLSAFLLAPSGAAFVVEDAQRDPPERPNKGVRRLMVRFVGAPGPCALTVLFTSGAEAEPPSGVEVRPLSDW